MLLEGDSKDYESVISEEAYSSDNEKNDLVDMCENKYNIDSSRDANRDRNPKEDVRNSGVRVEHQFVPSKRSLYPPINNNSSFSYLKNLYVRNRLYENNSQKSLLEYLKEEARLESEKINAEVYERKSFSPVYEPEIEEIKEAPKKKRGRKPKRKAAEEEVVIEEPQEEIVSSSESDYTLPRKKKRPNTPVKEKRSYRKRKQLEYIPSEANSEVSDQQNIESFADFADSMFNFHTKDKVKVYECPEPGCYTELPSLSRIKRHYLIHTNLKPFKCLNPNCGKTFSRKDNMIQHYRTHCNSKQGRL